MSTHSNDILKRSQMAEKFFKFNEQQDKTKPAQWWFQHSEEGLVLFCVFYTMACRWNLCVGCNLPSKCSVEPVSYRDIMAQIDYLFHLPEVVKEHRHIKKIIISNNGSILDQMTFPSTALMHLLAQINITFPEMSVLSIETRAEYVEWEELEFIARALTERESTASLEVAIGFEVFDDRIRNNVFKKGLDLVSFEKLVAMIGKYKYALKCYFMLSPVSELAGDTGVSDVKKGIDWLNAMSTKYDTPINVHLNPTYVAYGTDLEKQFHAGTYSPPTLIDAARAAYHARNTRISVFLGLYDEGLAVAGGSFVREGDDALIKELEQFNQTQNFDILATAISHHESRNSHR